MTDEDVERRIKERMERDLVDPEWQASMARSLDDVLAGRVIPWRLAFWPLPRWVFWLLFRIAPFIWGRKSRRIAPDEERS